LEKAKEVWQAKKRRKTEEVTRIEEPAKSTSNQGVAAEPLDDAPLHGVHRELEVSSYPRSSITYEGILYFQELAERRSRREHRQLPKCYRDIAPVPPASLPPPSSQDMLECVSTLAEPVASSAKVTSPSQQCTASLSRVRKVLKSARNIFGLFRQYYAARFPDHDPEENITSDDLIDASSDDSFTLPVSSYHPYPNQSSFLLGEWYWNDGERKSQSSFQNLLKIVGHPDFRPEDVAGKNWRRIDAQLSGEQRRSSSDGDGWEDEHGSGDWVTTPIQINVPFHK
jgi:hypothetical protein